MCAVVKIVKYLSDLQESLSCLSMGHARWKWVWVGRAREMLAGRHIIPERLHVTYRQAGVTSSEVLKWLP